MKKFKAIVTRTDEYEIELDENQMNEEWMEEFRKVFYNFHSLKEHVEQIAQMRARFGDRFIEGYGYPLEDGVKSLSCMMNKSEPNAAINIKIISEDDDCEVEIEEIKEK
jgi:hypothetical protein